MSCPFGSHCRFQLDPIEGHNLRGTRARHVPTGETQFCHRWLTSTPRVWLIPCLPWTSWMSMIIDAGLDRLIDLALQTAPDDSTFTISCDLPQAWRPTLPTLDNSGCLLLGLCFRKTDSFRTRSPWWCSPLHCLHPTSYLSPSSQPWKIEPKPERRKEQNRHVRDPQVYAGCHRRLGLWQDKLQPNPDHQL